jgi:hypothetical protein
MPRSRYVVPARVCTSGPLTLLPNRGQVHAGTVRRRPVLLLAVPIAGLVYARYVRPWQLTWGATPAEVARSLPSDQLVQNPTFNATRAISIDAAPENVWPWLVQVGLTRAGWYSYDLLDNLGHHSARRIVPELQHLAEGDIVPMSPDGKQGMRVHSMDESRSMVWGEPGRTTGHGSSTRRPAVGRGSSPGCVRATSGCHRRSPSQRSWSSATSG